MTKILVLGYIKKSIELFKKYNLEPIFIVSKYYEALKEQTYFLVNNLEDVNEILRLILVYNLTDIKAIMSCHEDAVFSSAILRKHFNLPGHQDAIQALMFRDKCLQKSNLPNSIQKTKFLYLRQNTTFKELTPELSLPFVIKPGAGLGSINTQLIHNEEQFVEYKNNNKINDISHIAEAYVKGEEYCVDGVVLDNKLQWFSVSKYISPLLNAKEKDLATAIVLSPLESKKLFTKVKVLLTDLFNHHQVNNTLFHLEFFIDNEQEFIFNECAIRLGGGLIPEIIKHTYDIDLSEVTLRINLGLKVELASLNSNYKNLHAFILLKENKLAGFKDLLINKFKAVEIDYPDQIKETKSKRLYKQVGHVIVSADNEADLIKKVQDIINLY